MGGDSLPLTLPTRLALLPLALALLLSEASLGSASGKHSPDPVLPLGVADFVSPGDREHPLTATLANASELQAQLRRILTTGDSGDDSCPRCPNTVFSKWRSSNPFTSIGSSGVEMQPQPKSAGDAKPGEVLAIPAGLRRGLWDSDNNPCPGKSRSQLAEEAYYALRRMGYTRTARYLERSRILIEARKPLSFLAPNNGAYERGKVPSYLYKYFKVRPQGGGVTDRLMSFLTMKRFRTYNEYVDKAPHIYGTLVRRQYLRSALLRTREGANGAARLTTGQKTFLGFGRFGGSRRRHSIVVQRNLFCNAIVIIQGVNRLLMPVHGGPRPSPGPGPGPGPEIGPSAPSPSPVSPKPGAGPGPGPGVGPGGGGNPAPAPFPPSPVDPIPGSAPGPGPGVGPGGGGAPSPLAPLAPLAPSPPTTGGLNSVAGGKVKDSNIEWEWVDDTDEP